MDLLKAKEDLTRRKSKNDQLVGERKGLIKQLKDVCGTSSLEQAELVLKQLGTKIKKEEKKYSKELSNFEKTYGHLLDD